MPSTKKVDYLLLLNLANISEISVQDTYIHNHNDPPLLPKNLTRVT